jgi:hypothetical protein
MDNNILTRQQVIDLLQNKLLTGQRLNIQNGAGILYIYKGATTQYNYKCPSGNMEKFNYDDVLKWVLNGRKKYKLLNIPSGVNSFAYELSKLS